MIAGEILLIEKFQLKIHGFTLPEAYYMQCAKGAIVKGFSLLFI